MGGGGGGAYVMIPDDVASRNKISAHSANDIELKPKLKSTVKPQKRPMQRRNQHFMSTVRWASLMYITVDY